MNEYARSRASLAAPRRGDRLLVVHAPDGCRRFLLKAGAALPLLQWVSAFAQQRPLKSRLALAVGNDAYTSIARLANAGKDAQSVAALLVDAEFATDLRIDATFAIMRDAIRTLAQNAQSSDATLVFFYYAGHGVQLDWRNYLLPVDARIGAAADLLEQGIDVGSIMTQLGKSGRTLVVVLDACRDNPFGVAAPVPAKGLSQFDAPPGSLLAFSTAPGSVAADGGAMYTQNLVRELATRDTRIEDALKRVRLSVRMATKGKQIPWESTSLETEVRLFPKSKPPTEQEVEDRLTRDLAMWNRVKGSKQVDDWIAYLREFPSGQFSEIAQNRLNYLMRREEDRTAIAAATEPAPPTVKSISPSPSASTPQQRREQRLALYAKSGAPAIGIDPPQLVIGPGLPVPVLLRPSDNPSSAGTYPVGRVYSVGDEATGVTTELRYRQRGEPATLIVTDVDMDLDLVVMNYGAGGRDTMGNVLWTRTVENDPRQQNIPAEYQVGKRWTTRTNYVGDNFRGSQHLDFVVERRERVGVPAGEFDCFKVTGVGYRTGNVRITIRQWLAPNFNFAILQEIERQTASSPSSISARTVERTELIACKQYRWTQA